MNKKKTWKAYVLKGTMIPWTETWNSYDVELESIEPEKIIFGANIKYVTIAKGYGSGCKVFVEDTERFYKNKKGETKPVQYGVFLVDANKIINNMDHGVYDGNFTICKRGQDYGIKIVEDE